MPDLSPEAARAEAGRRLRSAADHIQRAQFELELARQDLSGILGAAHIWAATGKIQDRTRLAWARIARFVERGRFGLDDAACAQLAKKEGARADT